MSGVFDRLQKRLEVEAQEGGISPLDLAALPPLLRKIMRHLLREYELTYAEIQEWAEDLADNERAELDPSLDELTRQFWLIRRGEGKRMRYQANLRRKAGSKLAHSIWGSLDAKIAAVKAQKDEPPVQE
jgi:hypothetical protein